MRQISRRMEMIHPTIGWRRDEHGAHQDAHGSCMDSLICITCSLENNSFSVLHYVMVALHYSVLHRFDSRFEIVTSIHSFEQIHFFYF